MPLHITAKFRPILTLHPDVIITNFKIYTQLHFTSPCHIKTLSKIPTVLVGTQKFRDIQFTLFDMTLRQQIKSYKIGQIYDISRTNHSLGGLRYEYEHAS